MADPFGKDDKQILAQRRIRCRQFATAALTGLMSTPGALKASSDTIADICWDMGIKMLEKEDEICEDTQ